MKNDLSYPSLYFNNARIQRQSVQKHVDVKIKKATKDVNLIRQLNLLLQRSSFPTVYKCFYQTSSRLWRCEC